MRCLSASRRFLAVARVPSLGQCGSPLLPRPLLLLRRPSFPSLRGVFQPFLTRDSFCLLRLVGSPIPTPAPPPVTLTIISYQLSLFSFCSPPPPPPFLPFLVKFAACEQPDCLTKIEHLTFHPTHGCQSLAKEIFAMKTNATLTHRCPGYSGIQVS